MTGQEIIRLVVFILPLGLDTFALSTVLGMQPLPPQQRLRLALHLRADRGDHACRRSPPWRAAGKYDRRGE